MSRSHWTIERLASHPDHSDHARASATCKTCGETRDAYTPINADPQGRAQVRADRVVESFLRSHPCYQTTASQRRRAAA